MARMARLVGPGYPHHVTQRGNRRQSATLCDEDNRYYFKLLAAFAKTYCPEMRACCLMPNHVHLVMLMREEENISR